MTDFSPEEVIDILIRWDGRKESITHVNIIADRPLSHDETIKLLNEGIQAVWNTKLQMAMQQAADATIEQLEKAKGGNSQGDNVLNAEFIEETEELENKE